MLNSVEWGEFRIGDLFDVDSWVYGKNKKYYTNFTEPTDSSIPVISGITENNGVNYYTEDRLSKEEVFEKELTITTRGVYSGTVFYHDEKFALANNILVMKMPNLSKNIKIFFGAIINSLDYGGYSGYPKKATLKEDIIQLPICKDGNINFSFMEKFIAELEATHIAELDAYLNVTGLKDYELTNEEEKILEEFLNNNKKWKEFDLIKIFKVKNSGNILSRDIIAESGEIPYLCASSSNNSVSTYIDYNENYIDKGNCIFIGGKTFVVTYQENDFYSNDSHNLILYLKNKDYINKFVQLYFITCIYKSLSYKYSWGDSVSNKKIQKDKIKLPILENLEVDYEYMGKFIKIIQKIVIKDLVDYSNKKNSIAKKILNK